MKGDLEVTRREFVRTAALLSASAAVGLPAMEVNADALAQQLQQSKEVAMGSVFPYGAVYFRKSNPPAEDWARDHQTAARVGMNAAPPNFTSNTKASRFSASFLERMDAVMSGMLGTVPVTSRSA